MVWTVSLKVLLNNNLTAFSVDLIILKIHNFKTESFFEYKTCVLTRVLAQVSIQNPAYYYTNMYCSKSFCRVYLFIMCIPSCLILRFSVELGLEYFLLLMVLISKQCVGLVRDRSVNERIESVRL